MKLLFYIFMVLPVLGLGQLDAFSYEACTGGENTVSRIPLGIDFQTEIFKVTNIEDGNYTFKYDKYRVKMKGTIKNGKMEGKWELHSKYNENFTIIEYHNGIPNGSYERYMVCFGDTFIKFSGQFENGLANGVFWGYDIFGNKYSKFKYSNGLFTDTTKIFDLSYYNQILPKSYLFYDSLGREYKSIDFEYDSLGNLIDSTSMTYGSLKSYPARYEGNEHVSFHSCDTSKNGVYKFYHQNEVLKAEISYKKGEPFGFSKYYDTKGNLIKLSYIDDLMSYDIFKGDTVNFTDSLGRRQGRWIITEEILTGYSLYKDFYIVYEYDYEITNEKYYCNNQPCSKWKIKLNTPFFYKPYKCDNIYEEYDWQYDTIAIYSKFCDEILVESGEITEDEMEFGHWKFYEKKSGKIMFEGDYYFGRKVGIWKIYNNRGKDKDEANFDECKNYLDYILLNHKYKFHREERIECDYRFRY